MKTIIIGLAAAMGLLATGVISLIHSNEAEAIYPQDDGEEVKVQYITFTEPMEIQGRLVK